MGLMDERSGLAGSVAIVSGGAGGIGEAITLDLARCGALVAVADRDGDACERISASLDSIGADSLVRELDVRNHDAFEKFFEAVDEHFGRLDVLVNVVGGTFRAPFTETRSKGWDTLIRTNFLHVVDACSMAVPRMQAGGRGGSIVNITTIEAHRAAPNFAVYSAMKSAVEQFSRTLAVELAPDRIRINNVAPDIVPTPGMAGISGNAETGNTSADAFGASIAIPMARTGTTEDVSNCVLFFASRLSEYVTSCTLHPDGGALASSGWFNWPGDGYRNTLPAWALDAARTRAEG